MSNRVSNEDWAYNKAIEWLRELGCDRRLATHLAQLIRDLKKELQEER